MLLNNHKQQQIDEVITTDSTPGGSEDKVTRVPVGGLLGEAIARIHMGKSVSSLFDIGGQSL